MEESDLIFRSYMHAWSGRSFWDRVFLSAARVWSMYELGSDQALGGLYLVYLHRPVGTGFCRNAAGIGGGLSVLPYTL